MKITKRILKQLVKEELQTALYEGDAAGLKGVKKLVYDVMGGSARGCVGVSRWANQAEALQEALSDTLHPDDKAVFQNFFAALYAAKRAAEEALVVLKERYGNI